MCIGRGIRVTACAFVTFVKGRLRCLLLLLLFASKCLNSGIFSSTGCSYIVFHGRRFSTVGRNVQHCCRLHVTRFLLMEAIGRICKSRYTQGLRIVYHGAINYVEARHTAHR